MFKILLSLLLLTATIANAEYKIVGYYPSWAVKRPSAFTADGINGDLITHLIFAFGKIDSEGRLSLYSPKDDLGSDDADWKTIAKPQGTLSHITNLKKKYPNLKILLSIGGWTHSDTFPAVAASPTARKQFAKECIEFCKKYQFDGVDIDWEFPGYEPHKGTPEDAHNFTLLLKDLYNISRKQKAPMLITIAGPITFNHIDKLELNEIQKYLSWINLMCYNYHGPWGGKDDKVTNHHAPLYATKEGDSSLHIDATVQKYISKGIPKKKLILGMPLYGRSFANVASTTDGLNSTYSGMGKGTTSEGVRSFADIKQNLSSIYTKHWDDQAKAPYLYDAKTKDFITYDDDKSLKLKCEYIKSQKLGGAMLWELSFDTHPGWDALRLINRELKN